LISDHIDLIHNTSLRSLHISLLDLSKSEEAAGHRSFSKIIQRILSPSLAHIEIRIRMFSCMDLVWLDFEKVAYELNHPRFSKLQECVVILSDNEDKMISQIRSEMSCLENRLSVTYRNNLWQP
jgi:hypothetical protein